MPSSPIAYIDIRVFVHSTEDYERVLAAAQTLVPAEFVESVVFSKSNATGHHGNPIMLLEARIKGGDVVEGTVRRLSSGLTTLDKQVLSDDIDQHFERGNLYLRLDKQLAYLGELRLYATDPIRLKIHFKKHGKSEVIETCRKLGLLP